MRRGKGGRGLGEEIGRGEVIPGVLSIPFLERLSLSQDSCCGHTTNLKAALPLGACLSSPHSPPQSSSWCLAPRLSRLGAPEPAAPPASPSGLCGRSLRAPSGPPAAPRLSQGCLSEELAPVPRVAAAHAHSLHPLPLFLKGHLAQREGEKSSRQVRLASGHLLPQWEGALGTAELSGVTEFGGWLWVRTEDAQP